MKTLHLPHISLALSLAACSLETKPDNNYGDLIDAGRDAQVTTEEDAASGDASQVHEGDASSIGSDAEVSKRPCNDACSGATPYCDEASDTCVACLDSTHCAGDPSAPRCEQGACVPCEHNDHCTGVTSGAVALGVCDQGSCVECTPEAEELVCGANACDPVTKSCGSVARGTVAVCRTCRSDNECQAGHKCIEVPFKGEPNGWFCMKQSAACDNPYRGPGITTVSRNLAPAAEYCAHNTDSTTCPAVVSLTDDKACTNETVAADCGAGSRCEIVSKSTSERCTYSCSVSAECPNLFQCHAGYCGGPSQPTSGTP